MTRNRQDRPNTKFEKVPFAGKYSMKNIPIPKENEYMKKLISQMEKLVKNMRWRALYILKDDKRYKSFVDQIEFFWKEETYGFKATRKPPAIKHMENFE